MKEIIGIIIGLTILAIVGGYYGSCRQARIYNIIHDTSFSCSDFFFAREQINSNTQTIKIEK